MLETWEEKQEIREAGSSKRLQSTETPPGINVSKKRKESSPLGKTNKTEDDDRGDTEATSQLETPAWAKHLLLKISEARRKVLQISDLRSELTNRGVVSNLTVVWLQRTKIQLGSRGHCKPLSGSRADPWWGFRGQSPGKPQEYQVLKSLKW